MPKYQNTGQFRYLVNIQAPTQTQDSRKDVATTWTTVNTAYAAIRPASGSERIVAAQLKAEVTHVVSMRFVPETLINPTHRLTFNDGYAARTLNVTSVVDQDTRHYLLTIYCTEVAG